MLQMSSSSSIVCGISTKFMVPLSLPPSFNIRQRKKILVLDYCGFNKVLGTRHVIIKASSDVASPSFWENFKPPKSSSTHSFSDILWPSAGWGLIYIIKHHYFTSVDPISTPPLKQKKVDWLFPTSQKQKASYERDYFIMIHMLNIVSATLVGSWTQIFGDSKPFQKDEVKNIQERCGNIILEHIEAKQCYIITSCIQWDYNKMKNEGQRVYILDIDIGGTQKAFGWS
ncbi:hypothetical protein P8452_14069 [Trifolium repens]|nr:hypothetical protein P8452_14069 [Trifolium repens]